MTPEDAGAESPSLSPDGRFVNYLSRRAGRNRVELLMTDIDANTTEVLGVYGGPGAWSRDSKTLAYALERPDSTASR